MYKVFIFAEVVYQSNTLEDALAFALSLHRSSNVKHTIDVYGVDDDKDFITLVKE